MSVLVALVAGFVLGTRSKGEEWEEVRRSLVALYGSDEFADVVSATRTPGSQVASGAGSDDRCRARDELSPRGTSWPGCGI